MKALFFVPLFLFSACLKESPQAVIEIYPEGFFSVNKQLYFSDGRRFYCGFKSWEHLFELRGTEEPVDQVMAYQQPPKGMKLIQECNMGILTKKFFE